MNAWSNAARLRAVARATGRAVSSDHARPCAERARARARFAHAISANAAIPKAYPTRSNVEGKSIDTVGFVAIARSPCSHAAASAPRLHADHAAHVCATRAA